MEIPGTSHYGKCHTLMRKQKQYHKLRVGLITFAMLENAFWRIVILQAEETIYSLREFFSILLYFAMILIIGVFVLPKKPKLLAITCILLFIGMILGWIARHLGIIMIGLFLLQIPETKLAVWLKQQEGYPHFNERLIEQMQNFKNFKKKGYQSEHKLDNSQNTEMPSVPEFAQDMPKQLSSDLTATEQTAIPEMMQDITDPAISDPEIKSASEFTPNLPETSQMQNNDLGTDKVLMKYSERKDLR
ncbi:MAG: hypothetical protein K2H82_06740 [Oscillospiraceae bacterium]|nr:hypothetical protein [Oscillospiraceae bacterium]